MTFSLGLSFSHDLTVPISLLTEAMWATDLHHVSSTKTFCLLSKSAAERRGTCLAKRTPPFSEILMLLLEPKLLELPEMCCH